MEGKTYFTSDTHYNHANIIRYCARPFKDLYTMNRELILRWNAVVGPRDRVYHLGDFALGKSQYWPDFFKKLNGYKILIRGNHDAHARIMKEKVGFSEVYEELEWEGWWLRHRPEKTNKPMLCGHVHEKWTRIRDVINVGVDVWDYRPVALNHLLTATKESSSYCCQFCSAELPRLEVKNHREHWKGLCKETSS